jgi:basic membrane protein A
MNRLENGANLGPYRILNQIGEGGMAKVYKAFQANMERYVALKVLPAHYADEPQFAQRFSQEARTIARLEHKNILPVYDFGEQDNITYLVMRYLEGGTLKDVLARGRLTIHESIEIMEQVCSALGYAHRQGVIHRDVKPANIMIDSEGAVYLTDFGIAKVVGSSSDLTATGMAIGTPAYMSPEQAVGDKIDGRTDIYALGVVLYEMILGRVPFKADTPMAVLMAHLHDPLPLPSTVDPAIDPALENVIIKTLAKEPGDRYQDTNALMTALRDAVDAAILEAQEPTLINLISKIRTSQIQEPTAQENIPTTDISDPELLEKLEALYIDGLSAYWIKDWEKAQARLAEVVSIDPNYKDAAARLAEIEKQSHISDLQLQAQEAIAEKEWQTAQVVLQEIISAKPDDAAAQDNLAFVEKQLELANLYAQGEQLFQAGQWQAVLNIFERIHQLDADFPDPHEFQKQATEALKGQPLETVQVAPPQPDIAEKPQTTDHAIKPDGAISRFKPWYGLVALVVVLVIAAGIWFAVSSRSQPEPKPLEAYAIPTSTPVEAKSQNEPATEVPSSEIAVSEATEDDCFKEEVLCVGLMTDVGEVDDKSFNQSAWEGVQLAEEELGAIVNYVETKDAKDYEANIALFGDNNYDIVVTVGFGAGEATLAGSAVYPDIMFIGVDQWNDGSNPKVTGLLFAEDKAGFLAGALAAMMTNTDTVAAVLGTDLVPPVVAFKEGYEGGARYINPDINLISTYHPGGLDMAFTDPEWGATTAKQAVDNGADVVFGAGGKTGNGALIEAASHEGLLCIGVDSDQWLTVPEAHPCLISSAMKFITPGVFDLIKLGFEGNFPGGLYFGEVGLAPFHDFEDAVPQEVKDTLDEIDTGLRDGSISTGYGLEPGG